MTKRLDQLSFYSNVATIQWGLAKEAVGFQIQN